MRSSRRTLVLVALAALAVGVVVLWSRGGMRGAHEVTIVVLDDSSGKAIADARVRAWVPKPETRSGSVQVEGTWTTGPDGRVRVGPVPGDALLVSVTAAGHVMADHFEVPPAEAESTVRLPRGSVIAGRVVGLAGQDVRSLEASARVRYEGVRGLDFVRVSTDGTFRFDTLPPGRAEVVVYGKVGGLDVSGRSEVDVGAEGVEIRFAVPPTVVARVVGPDGKPVAKAEAVARVNGELVEVGVENGRLAFALVLREPAAPWSIDVFQAEGGFGALLPAGPAHADGVGATKEDIEIRLPPERTISGVVRDEAGTPAAGVEVRAVAPYAPEEPWVPPAPGRSTADQVHGEDQSGDDGSFRIGQLGNGPYDVSTSTSLGWARRDWLESSPVRVASGTSGVSLVVRRGVRVALRVLDADGRPLDLAHAAAEDLREDGTADSDGPQDPFNMVLVHWGDLTLRPLDPSVPRALWVIPPDGRADLAPTVLAPWTPADTTVRLARARLVTGVVRDLAGRPVPRARAEWRRADGRWVGVEARDDGRFALRGLPLDPVTMRARLRPSPWSTKEDDRVAPGPVGEQVVAEPGARDVTLVVDPGAALTLRLPLPFADFVTLWVLLARDGRLVPIAGEFIADYKQRTIRGLDPSATYAVYAYSEVGTEVAWGVNLCTSEKPTVLDRLTGKAITVRVKAPPGAGGVDVHAAMHGISFSGMRRSPDRYVIPHLLDGTWPVTARAKVGGVEWTATAEVAAGGSVDLELKPAGAGTK